MPRRPAEPLSDAQREELVADLHALEARLRTVVADEAGLAGTVTLDQAAMGRVSRGDALQQQEMAKAVKRRAELRLDQVAAAFERLEDDEYGECPECGEPVGYRRLKAMPDAAFCVGCLEAKGR